MSKKSDLLPRVLSALVLLPAVLALCYLGGLPFLALIMVVALISAFEFNAMALKDAPLGLRLFVLLASCLMPLLTDQRFLPYFSQLSSHMVLLAIGWIVVGLFSLVILSGDAQITRLPQALGLALLGVAYVGGLFAVLGALRGEGFFWLVLAMAVTWPGDTGAYFAGRAFGKHALSKHISPNKTWEGFLGGVLGSVLGALFVLYLSQGLKLSAAPPLSISLLECVLLGVIGGVLGPIGDLAESLLKRAFGVKDSGKLIPGHGGFLDRVDAFLFNGLVIFTAASLVL